MNHLSTLLLPVPQPIEALRSTELSTPLPLLERQPVTSSLTAPLVSGQPEPMVNTPTLGGYEELQPRLLAETAPGMPYNCSLTMRPIQLGILVPLEAATQTL